MGGNGGRRGRGAEGASEGLFADSTPGGNGENGGRGGYNGVVTGVAICVGNNQLLGGRGGDGGNGGAGGSGMVPSAGGAGGDGGCGIAPTDPTDIGGGGGRAGKGGPGGDEAGMLEGPDGGDGGICQSGANNSLAQCADVSGIQHVVLVMMENRSFDHLLGWLPGAERRQHDIFVDRVGIAHCTYALAPDYQGCGFLDPNHSADGGRIEFNGGLCNGWLLTNDLFSIGYYEQANLSFFGIAAPNWTVCDNYFSAIMAETQPNRIYQHSAQTDSLRNRESAEDFLMQGFVSLPTIWDRLEEKGISSAYY